MAGPKRKSKGKLSAATKRARRLHRAGVKRLNELFAYDPNPERRGQGGTGRSLRQRSSAKRTPELRRRRRLRKLSHESRRRNR